MTAVATAVMTTALNPGPYVGESSGLKSSGPTNWPERQREDLVSLCLDGSQNAD
jgi:hypothetical protein